MKTIKSVLMGISMLFFLSNCASTTQGTGGKGLNKNDYSKYTSMVQVLQSIGGVIVKGSGQNTTIQLRGQNSLNLTQEPLFVVNSVPIGRAYSQIDHINPTDLVDVRIEKGLYATNRWGSEGNSGVIMITTRNNGGAKNKKKK